MKRLVLIILSLLISVSLCGCVFHTEDRERIKDTVLNNFNNFISDIGRHQLTRDRDLIGERNRRDDYTGEYTALCDHQTGKDVVFGGTSIQTCTVSVAGNIQPMAGTAQIRIRMGTEVTILTPEADGSFHTTFSFTGGGNYIMVDYEDFSGSIELNVEYQT